MAGIPFSNAGIYESISPFDGSDVIPQLTFHSHVLFPKECIYF